MNATDPPAGGRHAPRKQTRGRFAEINGFVDFTLATLTPSEVAVWLILWRDTKATGTAMTSQEDLARRAGCDVRTVRRAIERLKAADLLKVVQVWRLGVGPSVYRVRGVNPKLVVK